MDLSLPEDLVMIRETVKRFVDTELRPLEKGIEEAGKSDPEVLRRLRKRAAALGIYAHNLPAEIGGGGPARGSDVCFSSLPTPENPVIHRKAAI